MRNPPENSILHKMASSGRPRPSPAGVEHFALHGALLLRRARWLCLLSEATLAWRPRDTAEGGRIAVVFANGAICFREHLPEGRQAPPPPGHAKGLAERRKSFDWGVYERLRVVTTELRRLLAEGRVPEIRLGPRGTLKAGQLARILPWV